MLVLYVLSMTRRSFVVKIHEYQGKEILKKYGVPVPRGIPCFSVDDALKAAQALGGSVWVVKANPRGRSR